MTTADLTRDIVDRLFAATDARDRDAALHFFAEDATIDDVSIGTAFTGRPAIRDYLERYFFDQHVTTRVLSAEPTDGRLRLRVDFRGDFGREIGRLEVAVGSTGLIDFVAADLE